LVLEIVSNWEEGELERKLSNYARMHVTYYVVYDPSHQLSRQSLYVFELQNAHYVERADAWLPALDLGLTEWQGVLDGKYDTWLRWQDAQGNILLTGSERASPGRSRTRTAAPLYRV